MIAPSRERGVGGGTAGKRPVFLPGSNFSSQVSAISLRVYAVSLWGYAVSLRVYAVQCAGRVRPGGSLVAASPWAAFTWA